MLYPYVSTFQENTKSHQILSLFGPTNSVTASDGCLLWIKLSLTSDSLSLSVSFPLQKKVLSHSCVCSIFTWIDP